MVNVSTNLSTLNVRQGNSGAAAAAKAAEPQAEAQASAGAYEVNVTDAAKSHGEAVKGLTAEQIDILQQGIDNSYKMMISVLTENNAKLQGWLDEGIGKLAFGDLQIDSSKFGLPAVGTTPEEAAAAVAEGGDYSVDAVADRIFEMAKAIAGGDPEKLKEMQDAVEEGFKQAGVAWKDTMGTDKMPQITQDTHDAITKRFDELYAELTGKAAEEGKSE
jgi:ClpP class serine protease